MRISDTQILRRIMWGTWASVDLGVGGWWRCPGTNPSGTEGRLHFNRKTVLRGAGFHLNFHSCPGLVSLGPPASASDNAKRAPVLPKPKFDCLLSFQGLCFWDSLLHSQCLSVHEGISVNVSTCFQWPPRKNSLLCSHLSSCYQSLCSSAWQSCSNELPLPRSALPYFPLTFFIELWHFVSIQKRIIT